MFRTTIAAAAIAFGTAASANSSTLIVESGPSAHVGLADLNLHSATGRARLAGRIESAASGLCLENNIEPLDLKLQQIDCYRIAVASGRRQVDAIAGR